MIATLFLLTQAKPGDSLPPGATAVDHAFVGGAIVLLIALIWWQGRNSSG